MQHAHEAPRFLAASANFRAQCLVDGSNLRTQRTAHYVHFVSYCRKFTAHLLSELQNLPLDGLDTGRHVLRLCTLCSKISTRIVSVGLDIPLPRRASCEHRADQDDDGSIVRRKRATDS